MKKQIILLLSFLILPSTGFTEIKIDKRLLNPAGTDSVIKVWVFFTDKNEYHTGSSYVSPRGLARRKIASFSLADNSDYPVEGKYLERLSFLGAKLHLVYKWENCASFFVHLSQLEKIAALPFVKEIRPVAVYKKNSKIVDRRGLYKQGTVQSDYGVSYRQLQLLRIPSALEYLNRFRSIETPGSGVLIAFFDTGFRLDHQCFSYVNRKRAVKAVWDFVDNDAFVFDPDSTRNNIKSPYYANDLHGSMTLSLVAGYDPGNFIGGAWGASFVLARTEDSYEDSSGRGREVHCEEDHWAAAVVWAESLGVDIISSSLGYREGFQDSVLIDRRGVSGLISDYSFEDLDGKTTIVSRAARFAVDRGMVIVNSMGNEGSDTLGTLCAPADVDGVISIGAVTGSGEITGFSSTGPTADGRIKPDLVAQGSDVWLPVIYGSDNKSYNGFWNGTSFSAPMVTGVCALIMQSHGNQGALDTRKRLFQYCRFTGYQDSIDNYYGRGLPDALRSCMRDGEIYLTVKDTSNTPAQFARITAENGDSIGSTDRDGYALFRVKSEKLPMTCFVNVSNESKKIVVESTPADFSITMNLNSGLVVWLRDRNNQIIKNGSFFARYDGEKEFVKREADSSGSVHFTKYNTGMVTLFAKAAGYIQSDTVPGMICAELCTLDIQVGDIAPEKFRLYPNVLSLKRAQALNVEFLSGDKNQYIKIYIRSIDGALINKKIIKSEPDQAIKLEIRNELLKAVPGLYLCVIECNGKAYQKKFILVN